MHLCFFNVFLIFFKNPSTFWGLCCIITFMMKEKLERYLQTEGFFFLTSKLSEVVVLVKFENNLANVLQIIDYAKELYLEKEQDEEVKNSLRKMFSEKGISDTHILSLILAEDGAKSELLAKEVAKNLSVSFQPLLKKIRETEKQHLLSASKRRTNLENAFCLNGNADIINGKTIILCDDIKTTGYTFYICSEMLLKSGAKDVYCLSAAISEFESLPF